MTGTRRSPGTGGAYPYMTNVGERWCWKATMTVNGRRKPVNRRGYQSKGDALIAMRDAVVKAARGEEWDRPSRLTGPRVQPGGDDDPACWLWPVPETLGFADERSAESFLDHWNHKCAICGWRDATATDHDHSTGLVRGRLCHSCNVREGTSSDGVFVKYRERNPATILGVQIRYWSPFGATPMQDYKAV